MAEQTNNRSRAGEVAAELRAINARLDQIVANQAGIASWQLDVVRPDSWSNYSDCLGCIFKHRWLVW